MGLETENFSSRLKSNRSYDEQDHSNEACRVQERTEPESADQGAGRSRHKSPHSRSARGRIVAEISGELASSSQRVGFLNCSRTFDVERRTRIYGLPK